MTEMLKLKQIRTDGGTQSRSGVDVATIDTYKQAMVDGVKFPPVVVFHDGADYWLADGFHRLHARRTYYGTGSSEIEADVRQGTKRDAVLYSVGANATHGLPRTPTDKRRAIVVLLDDAEWAAKSDRWIAEATNTSPTLVGQVRAKLAPTVQRGQSPAVRTGKDGKARKVPAKKATAPATSRHDVAGSKQETPPRAENPPPCPMLAETEHERRLKDQAKRYQNAVARMVDLYRQIEGVLQAVPLRSVLGAQDHVEYAGFIKDIAVLTWREIEGETSTGAKAVLSVVKESKP